LQEKGIVFGRSRRLFIGCGLAAALLALVVCSVAAVLALAGRPVDELARVKALPVYPGASDVQVKPEHADTGNAGVLSFETGASVEDMFAYYDPALRQAGWQPVVGESDGGTGMYTRPEGSFQGIEFTGGSGGPGGGFPWFQVKTNQTPVWIHVAVSQLYHDGREWTHVAVELTEP
jgi:hypothetical protein